MPTDKLLELEGLTKYFYKPMGLLGRRKQVVQSVDHVSFHILRHETFGLVGESGCGKSTLGRTITRLYEPTEGKILYDGTDISHLTGPQLLPYRKRIQIIFRDPYASLDSRMTVMDIIREALDLHSELTTKEQRSQRVYELLDHVGLMREHANRYPHEFSGGQRQRIGIARALAVAIPSSSSATSPSPPWTCPFRPRWSICWKISSGSHGLTYLFIAHDLSMVRHISNRIGVMYLGKLVEVGDSEEIYQNHLHPYTEALLSSVPLPDPELAHRSAAHHAGRGTSPAPSIPLPAAGSAPAALTPRSCAPSRSRR